MAVIVTGGAGFIGSNIVRKLLNEGERVVIIDDFSSGQEENLPEDHTNYVIHQRKITDNLDDIFESDGITAIFHLAAMINVEYSIQHPDEAHKSNIEGLYNLLEYSRKHNVKRFIFSSSSAIYGDPDKLPATEDMQPKPMSPYALHKLMGEQYLKLYSFLYGLEVICLRYANVYGPRQNPAGNYANLIPKFIRMINSGESPTIRGDGKQTRDFVYVEDVANANFLAYKTENKEALGKVYNIGSGKSFSVNQITEELIKLSGKDIEAVYVDPVVEPRDTLLDSSLAEKFLGFKTTLEFSEGLQKTWDFFTK